MFFYYTHFYKTEKGCDFLAYIAIRRTTHNSVTVYVAGLDPEWTRGPRTAWWRVDDNYWASSDIPERVTSGGEITLNGLYPSTEYAIDAKITFSDNPSITDLPTAYATTAAEPVITFEWNSSEYAALVGQGETTAISATRFNELISTVIETLYAKGLASTEVTKTTISANNLYYSSSNTTLAALLRACKSAVYSGAPILATVFNTVRFSIGNFNITGLSSFYSGDIIYGWYFIQIVDALNGRI